MAIAPTKLRGKRKKTGSSTLAHSRYRRAGFLVPAIPETVSSSTAADRLKNARTIVQKRE